MPSLHFKEADAPDKVINTDTPSTSLSTEQLGTLAALYSGTG